MAAVQESSRKVSRLAFPTVQVPSDIGARVSRERLVRGWTQGRLAARAEVSRAAVYRLEGGVGGVRADTLFRIAHALDVSIRAFVPGWPEWEPVKGSAPGDAARERRRRLGLSLAQVAGEVGVSEATLSRFERGLCVSHTFLERVGDDLFACNDQLAITLRFVDETEPGTSGGQGFERFRSSA